jgi:ABC-type multidrug transport system ATPase subunit
MKAAIDRLKAAIERKEGILVYGDYDVDGTTAVVILKTAIELCGGAADFHVPHRIRDGYDMRDDVIERLQLAPLLASCIGTLSKGQRKRALLALLAKNDEIGPVFFSYNADNKLLYLNAPTANVDITPVVLRQKIKNFVTRMDSTYSLWNVKAWK